MRVIVPRLMFGICLLFTAADGPGDSRSGPHIVRGRANPSSRVAWLAVARERVLEHMESRHSAGMTVAAPDGTVEIEAPAEGPHRLAISIIDVDEGIASRVMPEGPRSADERLSIVATPGHSSVFIEAGEVHIVYARKRGHVWTHHAHDGGSLDADATSNGRIEIALSSLHSLVGQVPAPASVQQGDIIIALEPRTLRSGDSVVP